jgi:hypothetical protein
VKVSLKRRMVSTLSGTVYAGAMVFHDAEKLQTETSTFACRHGQKGK